ncbi:MAG: 2'-5' RNA ligase family protein [Cyanobacteria bacterium J06632_22]
MESKPHQTKTQRFFIALIPPDQIQAEANAIRQEFADRFNSRKAFNAPPHITLQPPFQWPVAMADRLTATVADFSSQRAAFAVQLQGFGAFSQGVVYINVSPSDTLMQLQADLSQVLIDQLEIRDRNPYRSYCPHMTVAFRDFTRSAFEQAWPEFEQRPYDATFTAQHLTLLIHRQRWEIYRSFALQ